MVFALPVLFARFRPVHVHAPPTQPVIVGAATFMALSVFVPPAPVVFTVVAMFTPFAVFAVTVLAEAWVSARLTNDPVSPPPTA